MKIHPEPAKRVTIVNNEWWDSVQTDVRDAIDLVDKITRLSRENYGDEAFDQATALDLISLNVRELRKLLENLQTDI
jgi:hypothetical protein